MQSLQKFKNIMIPALKRGEEDVGSYLQKHTAKSLFHLQEVTERHFGCACVNMGC